MIIVFSSSAFAVGDLNFNPNLMIGGGVQFDPSKSGFIYGGVKSYMIESQFYPNTDFLGIGVGVNTEKMIQLLISPISFTAYENISFSPDIGIGLNQTNDNTLGISMNYVF